MNHATLPWSTRRLALAAGSAVLTLSVLAAAAAPLGADPPASSGTNAATRPGIDIAGIDRAVVPGDNFFRFANGAWLAATEIPPDRASWGTGSQVAELTQKRTADLIREAATNGAAGSDARRVGDYYNAFMDEDHIEKLGLAPLEPAFKRIDAIKDRRDLARELGTELRADVDVLNATNFYTPNLFGLWVAQDLDDPSRYSGFLLQGGLTMPDRDYYLNPSEKLADVRTHYRAHIVAMLTLAHLPDPQGAATRIFELEHRMAEAHVPREESEDVLKGNNHWAAADFPKRAPGLDWAAYFDAAGLKQSQYVAWQPSAITGLAALVASEPLDTWKEYLRFHALERAAPYLPRAYVSEAFEFHGHVLNGVPELRARWKRGVDDTSNALGEAVGKLYVERYFPPSDKARAQQMVQNLIRAFGVRIDHLQWMSPATRQKAKAKLATLKVGVGYPDHWRDYSGLEVRSDDALGNAERAELFEYHFNLAKFGKPVDRGEWAMTPQLVNAVNLPAMNAINFPAAILQPPYFDAHRDVVYDYGSIGAVIGHEISHSFDDQGAMFDASGRLQNWWTPQDLAHFQAEGKRLAAQFDQYQPFPDVHVNGKLTLSENIADVAGLSVSHDAWHLTLNGGAGHSADGFNAEQLFFLSFAQSWREKLREPLLRRVLITDGHSPPEYRADTVRNLDAWYAAFNVQPGQRLFLAPADRVPIW
jgi:predicted metalloendopeptidase